MCHFWAQNDPFVPRPPPPPPRIFFWKIINIILMYLLASFTVQILKKFFQRIQSYEDVQFLGPKWPISPFPQMRILSENLLMSLLSLIYAYLHVKNQSQILIY